MRLIKLTEVLKYYGNNQRCFDADKIEYFTRINGATYLCMSTSSSAFEVVETPEQIMQLIEQAEEI